MVPWESIWGERDRNGRGGSEGQVSSRLSTRGTLTHTSPTQHPSDESCCQAETTQYIKLIYFFGYCINSTVLSLSGYYETIFQKHECGKLVTVLVMYIFYQVMKYCTDYMPITSYLFRYTLRAKRLDDLFGLFALSICASSFCLEDYAKLSMWISMKALSGVGLVTDNQ